MLNQKPLMLLLLVGYFFAPLLLHWVLAPEGSWYRPFIAWAGFIFFLYLCQRVKPRES